MRIRLYQIDATRDLFGVKHADLIHLKKYTGSSRVDSSLYDCVYEGIVDCQDLEDVYLLFHCYRPPGFEGHAMSVSDVVEVIYPSGLSTFYFCNSLGFKRILF